MKIIEKALAITIICGFIFNYGCASIVSDSSYPVMMSSAPDGAKVTVRNEDQIIKFTGITPSSIVLNAGDGYFDGEKYTFEFEKEGYKKQTHYLDTDLDGWYIGNLLFGGLIGLLIVDPLTGAMYKLPNSVSVILPEDPSLKKVTFEEEMVEVKEKVTDEGVSEVIIDEEVFNSKKELEKLKLKKEILEKQLEIKKLKEELEDSDESPQITPSPQSKFSAESNTGNKAKQ